MRKNTRELFTAVAIIAGLAMPGMANDWDSGIHAGLNLTDGNTDTVTFNLGLSSTWGNPDEDERFAALGLDYNYGEVESTTTVENVTASALYRRTLSGDMYGYLDGSFLHDDIAAIDARVILGPGVGYYVIREPGTVLGVEIGVAWIYEDQGGADDNIAALRIGQFLDKDLSENVREKLAQIERDVKRIAEVTKALRSVEQVRTTDYIPRGPKMLDLGLDQ